ncbi:MAG: NUDIX domain-containing protein [Thermomicrobiales bacterium]
MRLEAGETLAEAARREVREESGYEVEPIEVVAVDHGAFTGFEGLHWWRIVVSARLASTTSAPVEEQDVTDIAWLTVDQIPGSRAPQRRCGLALRCLAAWSRPRDRTVPLLCRWAV